jgi:L-malate glycosyltransferase
MFWYSTSQGTLTQAMEFNKSTTIYSPMVTGSGACIVHQLLAENLPGYRIRGIPPRETLAPFSLGRYRENADIVHTAPDLGPAVLNDRGISVVTFHGYCLDKESLAHASLAQRMFYRTLLNRAIRQSVSRASAVTAVSNFTAGMIKNHLGFEGDVTVIKNGIDESRFHPSSSHHQGKQCRVLFSGNLSRNKGAHFLQDVSAGLPTGSHLAFTSGLRASRQPASSNGRLVNLGRIPYSDMHRVYQNADILFFPTLREGLGLAAIEAMSCGLPVVTTRCSALPEVVDHGKGGFLCEPNNVKEMLERVRELITNPGLRQEMGQYNREKVLREFRLQKMIDSYSELFRSLS